MRIMGITGSMGVGKTWLTRKLEAKLIRADKDCTVIQVDQLRHFALGESKARRHVSLRRRVGALFGLPVYGQFASINYMDIFESTFESPQAMKAMDAIVSPVLIADTRRLIERTDGIVLLEWAMLLETGYGCLVDGPVVHVTCSEREIKRRFTDPSVDIDWEQGGSPYFLIKHVRSRQPDEKARLETAGKMGIDLIVVDTSDPVVAHEWVGKLAGMLTTQHDHVMPVP